MTRQARRLTGRARQVRNRRILAASDVCHLCGHPESDAVDHINAWVRSHDDTPANLAPAHHEPCPTCNIKCNLVKYDKEFAPIIRRSGTLD